MTHLSRHFSLDEMTLSQVASRDGLDNTPSAEVTRNLRELCETVLEPVRNHFWSPVFVSSGYRSPALNTAIGGVPTSAHVEGRAVDFTIPALTLREVYDWIAGSDLPYDQLILEYDAWIHVGISRTGEKPRRQCLQKFAGRGYETYDPADHK